MIGNPKKKHIPQSIKKLKSKIAKHEESINIIMEKSGESMQGVEVFLSLIDKMIPATLGNMEKMFQINILVKTFSEQLSRRCQIQTPIEDVFAEYANLNPFFVSISKCWIFNITRFTL